MIELPSIKELVMHIKQEVLTLTDMAVGNADTFISEVNNDSRHAILDVCVTVAA